MAPAEPSAMAATKPAPIGKASHSTPKPKAATAHKVPATGLVPGFYLNAGLFAVSSNGQNAYKKMEDAGLPVFAESIHSKKGPLTRLRVGPYLTRAEAVAAGDSVRALQLDAAVFKHPK
jgi:cell division septation protein DedD